MGYADPDAVTRSPMACAGNLWASLGLRPESALVVSAPAVATAAERAWLQEALSSYRGCIVRSFAVWRSHASPVPGRLRAGRPFAPSVLDSPRSGRDRVTPR